MSFTGAGHTLDREVASWPGVTAAPHRFGGIEYRVGRREIGHRHGDSLVDIPFPLKVKDTLVSSGRASRHHVHPDSGWISVYIKDETQVNNAIELLRMSYNIALDRHRSHEQQE